MDTKTFDNLFRDEKENISANKFHSLFADDPTVKAPAVAPEIVEEEPVYPPKLTKTKLPGNRIIPAGTTLPFPMPELPEPVTYRPSGSRG